MSNNIPNWLTLSRIGIIPLIVFLTYFSFPLKYFIICGLYLLACATDFLDGHVARWLNQTSRFGRIMDPVSDKLLVISVVVILLANGCLNGVHMVAALLIILREVLISSLREFLSEVKVIMPPSQLAKWKTSVQMVALAILLVASALPSQEWVKNLGLVLLWLAVLITVRTGYSYLRVGLRHMVG